MDIAELLDSFVAERTLKVDPQIKSLVLLGKIHGQNAIASLEKSSFQASTCESQPPQLNDLLTNVKLINCNDVYYWSAGMVSQDLLNAPGLKLNLIYPATEKHIRKYETQSHHMIRESPQMYTEKVLPFIETQKGDRIQWVYNILFHGKEAESIVYNDADPENGFVLLPDMKWDQKTMSSLYLCAIVRRTDLSSVRDLNGSHIEYLENIVAKIRAATCGAYDIAADELRIFVHYQPSYYHFHIHVVNIAHAGLGGGFNVGKAILIDDVIENLKMMSDYYQARTLTYQLGEMHPLWEILQE